jgi:hypothetical protein
MRQEEELTRAELAYRLEFACWTTLTLAPFLYWVNGSAVSTDQFAVRIGLLIVAACGAIGLRLHAWIQKRAGAHPATTVGEMNESRD